VKWVQPFKQFCGELVPTHLVLVRFVEGNDEASMLTQKQGNEIPHSPILWHSVSAQGQTMVKPANSRKGHTDSVILLA
jgi:hypothetical protein